MARSVFYGVGAFVGSITGPTTCAFWPDDPKTLNWDLTKLVKVDLANTPEACRQGKINPAQVEVDDFAGYGTGGLTRIGPMFPGGATMGTVYLEESRAAKIPGDPTTAPRSYEWMTVVYYDGALAGRRFHGFHAVVQKPGPGQTALVSLYPRGTSAVPGQVPFGTFWLDFGVHVHPADGSVPLIPPTAGSHGAVFIDTKASGGGVSPFDSPKTPRYIGGVVAPETRRVR
ncbi:MAG: hypothetical protein JO257_22495 [Deltaproteobacteria bacterium]|nr:hypothetical protein [Deltaproteobacteria bacterium]